MLRHINRTRSLLPALVMLLAGCAGMPVSTSGWPPQTQYQAPLFDSNTGDPLAVKDLARRLATTDVIVVGEYHGHHGAHLLQSSLQLALYQQQAAQLLSLEPFNANHQAVVDAYLAGDIGERELIEDADGWPNYTASYRPLMEFARARQLPVIAANAPADVVRCVGRQGESWLEATTLDQQQWLPGDPFFGTEGYRERFFGAMGGHHHGDDARVRLENSFKAQLLRDNTMAHRILTALTAHPDHQVLHINGTFHSEQRDGVVASLLHRAPELRVSVITPVFVSLEDTARPVTELVQQHANKGDYLYFLQPLPEEYRDAERYREHIRQQFRQAGQTTCGPDTGSTGSAPFHP